MARQVVGSDLTLLNAINEGIVPVPPLMGWDQWQSWRKTVGCRPHKRIHGYGTEAKTESALWRAVMTDRYGEHWAETWAMQQVQEAGEDSDAEEERDVGAVPRGLVSPAPNERAGETITEPAPRAAAASSNAAASSSLGANASAPAGPAP